MKVLINYDLSEKNHLLVAGGLVKSLGHTVVTSPNTLTIPQLGELKRRAEIDAIVCANLDTLQSIVHGDKKKITLDSFRGSVLQYNPQVLVVNSLAHVRTVKYGKWLLERDLDKLNTLHQPIWLPTFDLLESEEDYRKALGIFEQALIISIDIETDQHARITCVSYTSLNSDGRSTYSCVIPFFDFGKPHWDVPKDWERAIHYMRVFNNLPAPKLMFNAGYDASYFIRDKAAPQNLVLDMMGVAHSCWSELPKSLDFVLSLWDPHHIQWKHESDQARKQNDIRSYWYYCVKDSFNTLKALLLCYPKAPYWMVGNYQRKFKLTYPCLYCAFEGDKVNAEKKEKLAKQALLELDISRNKLRVMSANPNFNPGSPQQVANLIYKILGARQTRHGESTNVKVLNQVAEQHPLFARFIDQILSYRQDQKAYGTYFTFKELNGRLLYNIGPFGTETGRASSSASNFHVGTQRQNIPYYARDMLEADEGYILFEADNSKAEARIVAKKAKCLKLQEALNNPDKDFYKILAVWFFGIPYEKVSKDIRNKVMKRIIHGTNYMMQAETFIDTATPAEVRNAAVLLNYKMTNMVTFVKYLLGIYHRNFPEVSQHYVEIRNEIMLSHTLTSVMGYVRYFFGDIMNDHQVLRNAVAHEPQNLNVDILNEGFWKIYNELVLPSRGEFRLKNQVHDSIGVQIKRNEREQEYKTRMVELMHNPVIIDGDEFSIPVEVKEGFTFAFEE